MAIDIKNYHRKVASSRPPVTMATEKKTNTWKEVFNKDIQLFGGSFGLKKKQAFYADLRVLLTSGLDIQRALELIINTHKKQKVKTILEELKDQVIAGDSLSKALQRSGNFSDYEVYSIQIGEESGQLNDVLEELSIFYGKSIQYRQQLIGALSYPGFVIGFALLVIVFLLNYLVPLFSDVYQRIGSDLPSITVKVIALSDALKANIGIIALGLIGIVLLLYWQRQKEWFRRGLSSFLLRTPIFGRIIKMIFLARLCQSMYLLLRAKVPLLKAVELVQKMITFYPIEKSLGAAKGDLLNGVSLHEALRKFSFYPEQLIALTQVGEEAGNLQEMFKKMAEQYNQSIEQQTAIISSLIEPILIIGVGILVGGILIAMYLPLFQMSSGIG